MLVCGGRDERFLGFIGDYNCSEMPHCPSQGVGTGKPRTVFKASWFRLVMMGIFGMGFTGTRL